MRSFFSSSPDDPVAVSGAPGGWAGLSGWKKLAIVSGVAVTGLGVVMWPNFSSIPAPVKPVPADQHPPSKITDYQSPPPVEDVVARTMGDGPAASQGTPQRHVPTEMSLYVATVSLPPSASPAATQGTSAGASTDRSAFGENAAVTTNHATLVAHPDYVIRAGDVIPCLPVDAQNSGRPSFTTCRVPVWFRGTNQRRGLLPPGARLFGQMHDGLSAGQERLGISYSLIQTPWFNMPIAAPAGDAMGRGGVDADINTFFWDRAGAVALYALMDVAVGTGQNVASNAITRSLGSNGTTIDITGQSQSLASREFDATINRPPIGTRDQALPVTVTVGQDLDFYEACGQAMRVDPMACPAQ